MRTYTVAGLPEGHRAMSVRRALVGHHGAGVTVEIDRGTDAAHVDSPADPQVVGFPIEGAGCAVTAVGDWPAAAFADRSPP